MSSKYYYGKRVRPKRGQRLNTEVRTNQAIGGRGDLSTDEIFEFLEAEEEARPKLYWEEMERENWEAQQARLTEEYKDELVPGSAIAASKTKGKRFGATVDLVGAEQIHNLLMVAGFMPIAGIGADLLDSIIYGIEGEFGMAGISIIAAVPGFDWASPMGKNIIQNVKNTVHSSDYAAIVKSTGDKSKDISKAEKTGQEGVDGWVELENTFQGPWYMDPKAKIGKSSRPSFGGYRVKETWTNQTTGESITASVMWKIPEFGNFKKAKDFVRNSFVSREGFDRWKELYQIDDIWKGKLIDDWQLPIHAGVNAAGEPIAWTTKLFDDELFKIYKKEINANLDNAPQYIEFVPQYLRNHEDMNYLGVFKLGNPLMERSKSTGKWFQSDKKAVTFRGDYYYNPRKILEEARHIYSEQKMKGKGKLGSLWNAYNPLTHFGRMTSSGMSRTKLDRWGTLVHEMTHAAQMNLSAGNNIMVRMADGLEKKLGTDSANLFKSHISDKLALSEYSRYLSAEQIAEYGLKNPKYIGDASQPLFKTNINPIEQFDIGMPHKYPMDGIIDRLHHNFLVEVVEKGNKMPESDAIRIAGSVHQWKYIKQLKPGVAETITKNAPIGEHQRYVNWWWESEARIAELRSVKEIGHDYTQTKAYRNLEELYTPETIENMMKEGW